MMSYFNFDSLIRKYSREFTLMTKTAGSYNSSGDWEDGSETDVVMHGAILGFSANKIYRSEGKLTTKDKRLFMFEPIEDFINAEVIFGGNKYKVEEEKGADNAIFTGFYCYSLKWVSAFD